MGKARLSQYWQVDQRDLCFMREDFDMTLHRLFNLFFKTKNKFVQLFCKLMSVGCSLYYVSLGTFLNFASPSYSKYLSCEDCLCVEQICSFSAALFSYTDSKCTFKCYLFMNSSDGPSSAVFS